MKSSHVTVGSTPTLLVAADNQNRHVYLQVVGNPVVYVGDETVATTNGLPLEKHSAPHEFLLPLGQTMYGIVTAMVGTADVRIMTPDVD